MAITNISIFDSLSEVDLLELKVAAINSIKNNLGRIETSFTAPGISATYLVTQSPQDILVCVNHSLKKLEGKIVSRTYPRFY
jgi:hypothetical protein